MRATDGTQQDSVTSPMAVTSTNPASQSTPPNARVPDASTSNVVSTNVQRVVVYRNGALVVRTGTAARGQNVVLDLPLLFSSDSLRVRSAHGAIVDIQERVDVHGKSGGPLVDKVAMRELRKQLSRLDIERRAVLADLKALHDLAPILPATEHTIGVPNVAAWLSVSASVREIALRHEARLVQLTAEIFAQNNALKQLAAQSIGDDDPPTFRRGISFRADIDVATVEFEVEYFVSAAKWVPTYTLHLDGESARLAMFAMVAQATGEDWTNAVVEVSTTDLLRNTMLPTLDAWRVGRAQPAPPRAYRPLPSDLAMLFRGYDDGPRGRDAQTRTGRAPPPPPPAPPPPSVVLDGPVGTSRRMVPPLKSSSAPARDRMIRKSAASLGDAGSIDTDESAEIFDDDDEITSEVDALVPSAPVDDMRFASASRARGPMSAAPAAARGGGEFYSAAPRAKRPQPIERSLPPRLRYASMRLAGPDEPHRGNVVALDLVAQLAFFADVHDVEVIDHLARAVTSLTSAATRLANAPIPDGTNVIAPESVPHIFVAPGTHTIPSDGSHWRVAVTSADAKAKIVFRTVPRASEDVFRYAIFPVPTDLPFPSGPLSVYDDGAFRVRTTLRLSGGGKPLELNLGVDDDLRLVGRVVEVNQEEKGIVSARSRITHTLTVKIQSTAASVRDVVVFDRIPVPSAEEKDVHVLLLSSEPPPFEKDVDPNHDPLLGGMVWRLVLEPNTVRTLHYEYLVEIPSKREVVGGNRREPS